MIVYSAVYANLLFILMQIVSIILMLGCFILLLNKSDLFVHMIIYLENKILLIFILQSYIDIIPGELHFNGISHDYLNSVSVYLPFSPLPSIILRLAELSSNYQLRSNHILTQLFWLLLICLIIILVSMLITFSLIYLDRIIVKHK